LPSFKTAKTRLSNKSITDYAGTDLKPFLANFGTSTRAKMGKENQEWMTMLASTLIAVARQRVLAKMVFIHALRCICLHPFGSCQISARLHRSRMMTRALNQREHAVHPLFDKRE